MIKANFNTYGSYVTDSLYQWDLNQVLSVAGLNLSVVPEVHFSNANMDRAIVRQATKVNNVVSVPIPNSLLQDPLTIRAHIGIYEGDTFKVVEKVEIPVIARKRPSDYRIEDADEEIYSFESLKNAIANMVNVSDFNTDKASINASISTLEMFVNSRIDNIIAHNNDTEGNTELIDMRLGADGKIYDSAGKAVRNTIGCISNDISEFENSALIHGFADYTYGSELVTDSNVGECVSYIDGNSQAYSNGFIAGKDCEILGLVLHNDCTSTTFSIFVFDENDTLVSSHVDLIPASINDNIVTFAEPIEVKKGQYPLVRMLGGVFYYVRVGSSNYKEYQPAVKTLTDSPIRGGYDIVYKNKVIRFKDNLISSPSDYMLPKCTETDGEYTLIGRWFDKNGRKCANADGSSILLKSTGSNTLSVSFGTLSTTNYTPYFAYSIDGSEFIRQLITDPTITLPDDGEHIVWIVVDGMGETDPSSGKWTGTVGLQLNGISGGELKAMTVKNKQILFIGDSIVEGINALGKGANANTNSAISGFAWKTARKLNAIPLLCGYGGTSTLANASFHKAIEAIDYNMNGVPVNTLTPDIILIEHGYNDASLIQLGTYTEQDFINAYTTLIERLKVKYSGVPIICMIPFKQSLKSAIESVASNYSFCYVIDTAGYTVETSDSSHPSAIGATHAAESLSADIEKIFGKQFFI